MCSHLLNQKSFFCKKVLYNARVKNNKRHTDEWLLKIILLSVRLWSFCFFVWVVTDNMYKIQTVSCEISYMWSLLLNRKRKFCEKMLITLAWKMKNIRLMDDCLKNYFFRFAFDVYIFRPFGLSLITSLPRVLM